MPSDNHTNKHAVLDFEDREPQREPGVDPQIAVLRVLTIGRHPYDAAAVPSQMCAYCFLTVRFILPTFAPVFYVNCE